jgi:hypothetical protein
LDWGTTLPAPPEYAGDPSAAPRGAGVVIAERTVEHLLARYDEQRITVHAIETGARNMLIFQLVMRWLNSSKSLPARRKCKKLIFATC